MEERLRIWFGYFGQTIQDVEYECTILFTVDLKVWIDNIDRTVVFLAKFANLPPDWVEEQDIVRQYRLVQITRSFIGQAAPVTVEADNPIDWL